MTASPVSVSPDGCLLLRSDGSRFVWLGDTAWELFHRLDLDQARSYLAHRARHGFTVIQAVVLAELDGLRAPNAYGELPLLDEDPTRPNEAYFRHVDAIVSEASRLGLVIAMLPTWGDKLETIHRGAGPAVFNETNARTYGMFLGERYRKSPIIWMLGGDRNVESPEGLSIWRAMASGLRAGDGGSHLMTYHPRGPHSSAEWLHDEPWLDFNSYQSGHHAGMGHVRRLADDARERSPRKPFVNAEPAYEDIPVEFWEYVDFHGARLVPEDVLDERGLVRKTEHFRAGIFGAHDARACAYASFLLGAAGFTYGNNAIWQMHDVGRGVSIPCLHTWQEALDRPGALQMKHARSLIEAYPAPLSPVPELVVRVLDDGRNGPISAKSSDGRHALVYLPHGQRVELDLRQLGGRAGVAWHDPRTGERAKVGEANGERLALAPPSQGPEHDWVLILSS